MLGPGPGGFAGRGGAGSETSDKSIPPQTQCVSSKVGAESAAAVTNQDSSGRGKGGEANREKHAAITQFIELKNWQIACLSFGCSSEMNPKLKQCMIHTQHKVFHSESHVCLSGCPGASTRSARPQQHSSHGARLREEPGHPGAVRLHSAPSAARARSAQARRPRTPSCHPASPWCCWCPTGRHSSPPRPRFPGFSRCPRCEGRSPRSRCQHPPHAPARWRQGRRGGEGGAANHA